jgi:hypothetical protein
LFAEGVGHITAPANFDFFATFSQFTFGPVSLWSRAFGVGHNPASFSAVGRSNVSSSDNTPSRIEPHFGKVSEHADKSSSHKER